MVVISKPLFDKVFRDIQCDELVHQWHPNCLKAWLLVVTDSVPGLIIYFLMMYSAQFMLTRKKIERKDIGKLLWQYVKSILFGLSFCGTFMGFNCIQRTLLGHLNYYVTTYASGIATGLTAFLSPKPRIVLESTCFSIMAVECLIRYLAYIKVLPRNVTAGIPYFMVTNALTMLLLWKKCNNNNEINITWIFKPYTDKDMSDNKVCCHKGTCLDDCMKVSKKYFLIGLGISSAKFLLKFFKSGEKNPLNLLNSSYLKEPLFLWSYVCLHKSIQCILTLWRGKDSQNHALLAGLLSGISYAVKPNLSIAASQTVILFMALFNNLKKKYRIPKLPYYQISFTLSTMLLVHFLMVNKKLVPNFFVSTVSRGSAGRIDEIIVTLEKLVNESSAIKTMKAVTNM